MPRRAASSNAKAIAESDDGDGSTPTTTRPASGPASMTRSSGGTTTVGQVAWVATWIAVEPRTSSPSAPSPLEPRTSSEAVRPRSISASAAGSVSRSEMTSIPGAAVVTQSTASARCFSAASRTRCSVSSEYWMPTGTGVTGIT